MSDRTISVGSTISLVLLVILVLLSALAGLSIAVMAGLVPYDALLERQGPIIGVLVAGAAVLGLAFRGRRGKYHQRVRARVGEVRVALNKLDRALVLMEAAIRVARKDDAENQNIDFASLSTAWGMTNELAQAIPEDIARLPGSVRTTKTNVRLIFWPIAASIRDLSHRSAHHRAKVWSEIAARIADARTRIAELDAALSRQHEFPPERPAND